MVYIIEMKPFKRVFTIACFFWRHAWVHWAHYSITPLPHQTAPCTNAWLISLLLRHILFQHMLLDYMVLNYIALISRTQLHVTHLDLVNDNDTVVISHRSMFNPNSNHWSSHGAVKGLVGGGQEGLSCHDRMRSNISCSALAIATRAFVLESGLVLALYFSLGEFV